MWYDDVDWIHLTQGPVGGGSCVHGFNKRRGV
jgi:hypothetical protein